MLPDISQTSKKTSEAEFHPQLLISNFLAQFMSIYYTFWGITEEASSSTRACVLQLHSKEVLWASLLEKMTTENQLGSPND